ncbi:hypothetical protein A4X06_0g8471 [Tilletia controversa]|uniref:Uncharacterized protein n=1 Tax=Tilletia controversa TaxID=13291 RepID=A0A8X7ST51_9BASI|nr:hypothetical protein A4X06_0g8471 [Tilletia controversa]
MVAKPWIDVGVWIVWIVWIDWILHIHFRYLPRPIWRRLVNTWERWPGPLRCKSHAEAQKTLKRSLYAVVLASMASPCPFVSPGLVLICRFVLILLVPGAGDSSRQRPLGLTLLLQDPNLVLGIEHLAVHRTPQH